MHYYVLFLHEWHFPEPVYYMVDLVEAETPWQVLQEHLPALAQKVRAWLEVDENDLDDDAIAEALIIIPTEAWMHASDIYRRATLKSK